MPGTTTRSSVLRAVGLRCGIYCRISRDDTKDELGVRRQERNCRKAVDSIGGAVAYVYVDDDRSASFGSKPRPRFEQLVADLHAGLVDVVVCQNQDRLTRDSVELESLMRLLRELGHDHFLTASSGRVGIKTTNERLGYRVKGLFDTSYSEYISEKITEQKADLAARGLPSGGGRRAFGFSCSKRPRDVGSCKLDGCKHDGGMSLIPWEADGLRRAAALILDGGTIQSAADMLSADGIGTVTGGPWAPDILKRILLAPRVTARRVHKGEEVGDAAWPPILDRSTWERLRAELADRHRPAARPSKHLLSGIVTCGICGKRLGAQWVTRPNGSRKAMYWCRSRRGGCGRLSVAAGYKLEDHVTHVVGGWLADPDLAADITAVLCGDTDDVDALVALIEADETTLTRLARERIELDQELFEYQASRAPVKESLTATRARLAASRRKAAAATPLGAVTVEELCAAWPAMAKPAQREVIAALATVSIRPVGKQQGGRWDPARVVIRPVWET